MTKLNANPRSGKTSPAIDVWLPWTDPRSHVHTSSPNGINLCHAFWTYLQSPAVLTEALETARTTFTDLDARTELRSEELWSLSNAARTMTVLDDLSSRRSWPASRWDEYLVRVSRPAEGWLLRLDRALPDPELAQDGFAGKSDGGPLALFERFLEENDPLATIAPGTRLVLAFEELGQLPFLIRFARFASQRTPRVSLELRDQSTWPPGALKQVGAELRAAGLKVPKPETPIGELSPKLSPAQLVKAKKAAGRSPLRVVWTPSMDGLLKGTSQRALAGYIAKLTAAKIKAALVAYLPVAENTPQSEAALFGGFDGIYEVQWQLDSLQVHARAVAAKAPRSFDAWKASMLERAGFGDVFQAQVQAELDNQALAPHQRRVVNLEGASAKLQRAPGIEVRSRYPLDALSDYDPTILCWPFSYGRSTAIVDGWVSAAPRRKPYKLTVGGRLVFGNRSEFKLLEHFATPTSVRGFLDQHGDKLGVELADLESLVSEGILMAERVPLRKRKASGAKSQKGGYLHLVGIGPGGGETVSSQTLDAIRDAEEIWIQDLGMPGMERTSIRSDLGTQKIMNTVYYYGTGQKRTFSRNIFYELATRRAIDMANKGRRITWVFSGSPIVWVEAYTISRHYLEQHPDFDLRITNAMSFIDSVFMPTPIGGIVNLQLRGGSLTNPDVSPEIDCILGQVGDSGAAHGVTARPETATETLERLYPPDHPVFIVGNDEINSEPLYVESTASEVANLLPNYVRWYLCLVIPSLRRAQEIRDLPKTEKKRQMLSYLRRS